jgi:phasin family protein
MSSLQAVGFPLAHVDLTKAWASFKTPSLDVGTMLEAQRKNAAALTTANQIAFDGLKAFAERQGELIKTTVDDYGKMTSDVLAAPSLEDKATRQADAARHIYASTVARLRELSEIALKANVAAVDILNARITEAFDEFKALFAPPAATPAASSGAAAPVAVEPVDVADQVAPVEAVVEASTPDEPPGPVKLQPAPDAPSGPVEPQRTPDPDITAAPKTSAPAPRAPRRPPSRR